MRIRANLRRARKRAKLSQEALASAIDTTQQTYRNIELGVHDVKLTHALRIAEKLGYDVTEIRELFGLHDVERADEDREAA